jgi:hypothetical protein
MTAFGMATDPPEDTVIVEGRKNGGSWIYMGGATALAQQFIYSTVGPGQTILEGFNIFAHDEAIKPIFGGTVGPLSVSQGDSVEFRIVATLNYPASGTGPASWTVQDVQAMVQEYNNT